MERTHEPCVPTCLLPTNHLIFRLILKFNIQSSKFKGKVPTLLSLPYYAIIAALRLFKVGLGAGQKNIPAVPKDYRETPHVGVDGFEPPTLCL